MELGRPAILLPGKPANLEQVWAALSEVTQPQSSEHYFRMATKQRIILHYMQISTSFKACTINFCTTLRTRTVTVNSVPTIHIPCSNYSFRGLFLLRVRDNPNGILVAPTFPPLITKHYTGILTSHWSFEYQHTSVQSEIGLFQAHCRNILYQNNNCKCHIPTSFRKTHAVPSSSTQGHNEF